MCVNTESFNTKYNTENSVVNKEKSLSLFVPFILCQAGESERAMHETLFKTQKKSF